MVIKAWVGCPCSRDAYKNIECLLYIRYSLFDPMGEASCLHCFHLTDKATEDQKVPDTTGI